MWRRFALSPLLSSDSHCHLFLCIRRELVISLRLVFYKSTDAFVLVFKVVPAVWIRFFTREWDRYRVDFVESSFPVIKLAMMSMCPELFACAGKKNHCGCQECTDPSCVPQTHSNRSAWA